MPRLALNINLCIRNATSGINDAKALREHLKNNMAIQSASGTQMDIGTETIAKKSVLQFINTIKQVGTGNKSLCNLYYFIK